MGLIITLYDKVNAVLLIIRERLNSQTNNKLTKSKQN